MRKVVFILLLGTLVFAGCVKKNGPVQPTVEGVTPTGVTLDVSERNGGTATTTPGDVLYLKLVGQANTSKQWSAAAPTSGDMLLLTKSLVSGLRNEQQPKATSTSEWWFKVEKVGVVLIQFNYGTPGQKAEKTYKLNVVSQ